MKTDGKVKRSLYTHTDLGSLHMSKSIKDPQGNPKVRLSKGSSRVRYRYCIELRVVTCVDTNSTLSVIC